MSDSDRVLTVLPLFRLIEKVIDIPNGEHDTIVKTIHDGVKELIPIFGARPQNERKILSISIYRIMLCSGFTDDDVYNMCEDNEWDTFMQHGHLRMSHIFTCNNCIKCDIEIVNYCSPYPCFCGEWVKRLRKIEHSIRINYIGMSKDTPPNYDGICRKCIFPSLHDNVSVNPLRTLLELLRSVTLLPREDIISILDTGLKFLIPDLVKYDPDNSKIITRCICILRYSGYTWDAIKYMNENKEWSEYVGAIVDTYRQETTLNISCACFCYDWVLFVAKMTEDLIRDFSNANCISNTSTMITNREKRPCLQPSLHGAAIIETVKKSNASDRVLTVLPLFRLIKEVINIPNEKYDLIVRTVYDGVKSLIPAFAKRPEDERKILSESIYRIMLCSGFTDDDVCNMCDDNDLIQYGHLHFTHAYNCKNCLLCYIEISKCIPYPCYCGEWVQSLHRIEYSIKVNYLNMPESTLLNTNGSFRKCAFHSLHTDFQESKFDILRSLLDKFEHITNIPSDEIIDTLNSSLEHFIPKLMKFPKDDRKRIVLICCSILRYSGYTWCSIKNISNNRRWKVLVDVTAKLSPLYDERSNEYQLNTINISYACFCHMWKLYVDKTAHALKKYFSNYDCIPDVKAFGSLKGERHCLHPHLHNVYMGTTKDERPAKREGESDKAIKKVKKSDESKEDKKSEEGKKNDDEPLCQPPKRPPKEIVEVVTPPKEEPVFTCYKCQNIITNGSKRIRATCYEGCTLDYHVQCWNQRTDLNDKYIYCDNSLCAGYVKYWRVYKLCQDIVHVKNVSYDRPGKSSINYTPRNSDSNTEVKTDENETIVSKRAVKVKRTPDDIKRYKREQRLKQLQSWKLEETSEYEISSIKSDIVKLEKKLKKQTKRQLKAEKDKAKNENIIDLSIPPDPIALQEWRNPPPMILSSPQMMVSEKESSEMPSCMLDASAPEFKPSCKQ